MNKIRFLTAITATLLLTVFLCTYAAASTIPQPSECFYVYDEADVISDTTRDHIIAQNDKLFYSTGSQIVFAVVKNIGDSHIRDYTKKMFTEWDIGDVDEQNGVLVLISIENDNYWAIQGIGIDDKLTSTNIKSMTDNYLEPYFVEKNYDKGILTLFDKLVSAVADIYGEDLDKVVLPEGGIDPYGNPKGSSSSIGSVIITIFIVIVVIAIIITVGIIVYRNVSANRYRRRNYKPSVMIQPGTSKPVAGRLNTPHSNGNMPRQNPNMQRPNGNMPRQNPNMQRPNGNMPRQNPNLQRPNGNMPRQNPNMQRPNGNMPRQNPNMQRPNGNMPRQNPNMQRPNGNMPRQNPNMQRPNGNMPRQNAGNGNSQR